LNRLAGAGAAAACGMPLGARRIQLKESRPWPCYVEGPRYRGRTVNSELGVRPPRAA